MAVPLGYLKIIYLLIFKVPSCLTVPLGYFNNILALVRGAQLPGGKKDRYSKVTRHTETVKKGAGACLSIAQW